MTFTPIKVSYMEKLNLRIRIISLGTFCMITAGLWITYRKNCMILFKTKMT